MSINTCIPPREEGGREGGREGKAIPPLFFQNLLLLFLVSLTTNQADFQGGRE